MTPLGETTAPQRPEAVIYDTVSGNYIASSFFPNDKNIYVISPSETYNGEVRFWF